MFLIGNLIYRYRNFEYHKREYTTVESFTTVYRYFVNLSRSNVGVPLNT